MKLATKLKEHSDITVITSITGEKDHLDDNQCVGDARWVAFMDKTQWSNTWEIKKAYDKFVDPRRNSRAPKILTHKFVNTGYSIYVDGNVRLLKTPEELVEKYLKDHDFAVFKHPSRDCLYDEAMECAKLRLDDPENIIEQVVDYELDGFAKGKGLAECMILLRRHTPMVELFNEAWWAEYTRYSRRDQISFPYAVDKVGLRINLMPEPFVLREGKWTRDDAFQIIPHIHFEGNFNQTQ